MRIEEVFEQGGWLATEFPGYQLRQGQLDLAVKVQEAILSKKHLLAEAGTGSGKSFATCIPAAIWAIENRKTVIVVTSGITLQEQLIGKDLPFIRQLLAGRGLDFKYALIKGMNNYLCRLKLEEMLSQESQPPWLADFYQTVERLSQNPEFVGDKSEFPAEYDDWDKVSVGSHDCLRSECPAYETCGFFKARARAAGTHMIVTNYHMLFADVVIREVTENSVSLLPDSNLLIFDEAADAAEIAMTFCGTQLTPGVFTRLVGGLKGCDGGISLGIVLKKSSDALFTALDALYRSGSVSVLERPLAQNNRASAACSAIKELQCLLEKVSTLFSVTASKTESKDEFGLMKKKRLRSYSNRASELTEFLNEVLKGPFLDTHTYFLEPGKYGTSLNTKQVNIGPWFQSNLFSKATVVAVSATLVAGNSFEFVATQLGLAAKQYASFVAGSPFDPERMLAVVPRKFPAPNDLTFCAETAKVVGWVAENLKGRTMALFTSHKNMQAVAAALTQKHKGLKLYVQGTLPKSQILSEFKAHPDNAVILATASFWQGIDIPGQTLSCVIIDKIPFARPDDPVLSYVDRHTNGAGFFGYSVPKAILTLKQGIGRLIRTETDYGAVMVLDNRIRTKGYGAQFWAAFPSGCWKSEKIDSVADFFEAYEEESAKKVSNG